MEAQRLLRHIGGLMPVLCLIAARCQRDYNVWPEQAGAELQLMPISSTRAVTTRSVGIVRGCHGLSNGAVGRRKQCRWRRDKSAGNGQSSCFWTRVRYLVHIMDSEIIQQ